MPTQESAKDTSDDSLSREPAFRKDTSGAPTPPTGGRLLACFEPEIVGEVIGHLEQTEALDPLPREKGLAALWATRRIARAWRRYSTDEADARLERHARLHRLGPSSAQARAKQIAASIADPFADLAKLEAVSRRAGASRP